MSDDARSLQVRRAASLLAHDEELRTKKRVLASLVVHDLRSPLSGALAYVDLVRAQLGTASPDELAAHLAEAHDLLVRGLSLVATILDVDELEDGMLRAKPQSWQLAPAIDAAWRASLSAAAVRDLRWESAVSSDLAVDLDPDLCGRVLENLFDNAIRYATRGGRVAVAAEVSGGVLELTVGNDGPAVQVSEREAIFGRYHQVEARRASARANRGLGLYFCRLAIEAHGGSITVEERGELRTTFVVRVPQPPQPPPHQEPPRASRASDPALPRTTTAEVPPIPRPKSSSSDPQG